MKNSTPDRLACVDLPAFPLQLLLRRHPEWVAHPVAVVTEDKPQGLILWVNERARQLGVLPGLRYAAALSLAFGLRAGEIFPGEIEKASAELTRRLMGFTPEVEPSSQEPGIFWLNGKGLKLLYSSPMKWAQALHASLEASAFHATIVVGFTRFGTYAVAKEKKGITIFRDPGEERNTAQQISLDRLNLDPDFRDVLFKLGIKTVGALLSLPPGALRERFGPKAHYLYRMAAGQFFAPLHPSAPEEPITKRHILDDPESDAIRLLFLIKQLLHPMLAALAERAQALAALWLSFLIDRSSWLSEQIRPAAPTLDAAQILDLVRLRLESLKFSAGVVEIKSHAEGYAATTEQLRLFVECPTRDLDAANRALARLRAEFGDAAVVHAKIRDGHLPEARFSWEPLSRVTLPRPDHNPAAFALNDLNGLNDLNVLNCSTASMREKQAASRVLVRRIAAKPIQLPDEPRPTHEDGWLISGPQYGTIDKLMGPYVLSGGWWNRDIHREYYFAETRHGDFLWLYYDRVRRRWFLQGWVE